jgi:hypothetical protein
MNGSVGLVQGVYGFIAGLWPLVSIGTVQRVTRPIVDLWLVNTGSVIVTEIDGQHGSEVMPSRLGASHRARGPSGVTHPAASTCTRPVAYAGAVYGGVGVTGRHPPGHWWTYG